MANFIEIKDVLEDEKKGDKSKKEDKESKESNEYYVPIDHICLIKRDKKTKVLTIYLTDRSSIKTKEDITVLLGRIKHTK